MPLKTIPFDGSEYLDDDESQAELVMDAVASGDAKYIALALGVVARARGMTSIANETGIPRSAIYDALSDDSALELSTLLQVAKALGSKPSDKPPQQAAE
jgi:probable addiction module antidote protein